MKFRDRICEHLAQYKCDTLHVSEEGIFNYRGEELLRSHILPLATRDLNILKEYRAEFFSPKPSSIKLHRYFHHLNSSQALCINLFQPLMSEGLLSIFLEHLKITPSSDLSGIFEQQSPLEVASRKTSFDLYINNGDKGNVFVEVKYTEEGFGKAATDDEHRKKFKQTYLPLLRKSKFLVETCQEEATFLRHYQVLRNLVHITETSYVVFLYPSANITVQREACAARNNFLTDAGKARLKLVPLEDFVTFLEARLTNDKLGQYYTEFRKKYLPPASKITPDEISTSTGVTKGNPNSEKPDQSKELVILNAGIEGGGLTIYGIKRNGNWMFRLEITDNTPELLNEESIYENHGWVNSLPEAISQIRWPWNCFYPAEVHSEFAAEILQIKIAKDKEDHSDLHTASQWERLCLGLSK